MRYQVTIQAPNGIGGRDPGGRKVGTYVEGRSEREARLRAFERMLRDGAGDWHIVAVERVA